MAQQQQQQQPQESSVGWERLHHFPYPYDKDAVGVTVSFGKCLVLPTSSTDGAKPQIYEWNLRRRFPFPFPLQPRWGGMAVNWNEEVVWVLGGADEQGCVLTQLEQFPLSRPQNPDWKWCLASSNLTTPRLYASAVAILTEQAIVIIGGRNGSWQELDFIEVGKSGGNQQYCLPGMDFP